MKKLLILIFIIYSLSFSFANSNETIFLKCPIVVKELVERSPNLTYANENTISEMRYFKLKIKKFDAHLTIHSAMILENKSVPLDKFFGDNLTEEETDIKNSVFKWNYTDEILVDNGLLNLANSKVKTQGIIWYRDGDRTVVKYSHNSNCKILDKKNYKQGIKGKYQLTVVN